MSHQNETLDDIDIRKETSNASANSDYINMIKGRAGVYVENKNDREIVECSDSSMTNQSEQTPEAYDYIEITKKPKPEKVEDPISNRQRKRRWIWVIIGIIGIGMLIVISILVFVLIHLNNKVHGNWNDWSNWSVCSATCDIGMRSRFRNCDTPRPSLGGNYCAGTNMDYSLCTYMACADGGWANWTDWNNCTAVCGGGFRTRNRLCNNPTPSAMGKYCMGQSQDVYACNGGQCPAFSARKTSSTGGNVNDIVPFQTETLDIGNGFNNSTSIYTAPLTGTYSFSWTFRIYWDGDYTTGLVVNNVVKHRLQTTTDGNSDNYVRYVTSTAHKIVGLNKGDTVFIKLLRKNAIDSPFIISNSVGYSSFEGWMLN